MAVRPRMKKEDRRKNEGKSNVEMFTTVSNAYQTSLEVSKLDVQQLRLGLMKYVPECLSMM